MPDEQTDEQKMVTGMSSSKSIGGAYNLPT